MANRLNAFLDNFTGGLLTPSGNLKDFQHAARLYTNNVFALAPKTKFLYFVVFSMTEEALTTMPQLAQRNLAEINMLVKSVDLPQYSAEITNKNQYNRKKNIQTRINYSPSKIDLHDDNLGVTTMLLEGYYKYYFNDGTHNDTKAFDPRNTYKGEEFHKYNYGLNNRKRTPFFRSIKLYQFARQQYTEYTLVNPLIESWGHDTMDQTEGAGMSANVMSLQYESVFYNRGSVSEDDPATFATRHYDTGPSPLSIQGGGVRNIFGTGGILDGASSVLTDINTGQAGLGTLLDAARTVRNARNLTFDGIVQEGFGILNNSLRNIQTNNSGGVPNTLFPKSNGQGGIDSVNQTQATLPVSNNDLRSQKVLAARTANELSNEGVSVTNRRTTTVNNTSVTTTRVVNSVQTATTGGGTTVTIRPV
jgi:hypothetical protein